MICIRNFTLLVLSKINIKYMMHIHYIYTRITQYKTVLIHVHKFVVSKRSKKRGLSPPVSLFLSLNSSFLSTISLPPFQYPHHHIKHQTSSLHHQNDIYVQFYHQRNVHHDCVYKELHRQHYN